MSKKIHFYFLTVVLFFSFPATSANSDLERSIEEKAQIETTKILKESKTIGELVNRMEPKLDQKSISFLKSKITGLEKTPIQIKVDGGGYILEVEKNLIPFQIKKLAGSPNYVLTINHKEIEFDPSVSIEIFWEKVSSALPRESITLWSLIIPHAHALPIVGVVAAAAATGGMVYSGASASCSRVDLYTSACEKIGFSEEMIIKAARFENDFTTSAFTWPCKDKKGKDKRIALRQCLKKEYLARRPALPKDLVGYFGPVRDSGPTGPWRGQDTYPSSGSK